MNLELIPVIELGYCNQGIPDPGDYPWWEHPLVWDNYRQENFKKAGFSDTLKPYLAGSAFYKLIDFSDDNLKKLTMDYTEELRNGQYRREQTSPLSGGYILRVDGQNMFFPQCCGDLGDIAWWEKLSMGKDNAIYEGHPEPRVIIKKDTVSLDFTVGEYGDPFQPPPPFLVLELNKKDLKIAVSRAKEELIEFEDRLEKINKNENLGLEDIADLLICRKMRDK